MTVEQHQTEVKKLNKLESKLTKMIIDKNDSDLLDEFFKWQDQRNVCNKGFIKFCDSLLKQ